MLCNVRKFHTPDKKVNANHATNDVNDTTSWFAKKGHKLLQTTAKKQININIVCNLFIYLYVNTR
jgi:hypothetical protein